MKKFNRFVSLCLAVLLICMALPLSVGALSSDFVYGGVWIGDEAFSGEAEDLTPMDMQICEIDTKKALNAQEEIVDLFNLDGADLTGWKLWGVIYATTPEDEPKCEKLADLELDFCFDSYTDDEFNDIASAYGEWFIEPVIDRKYWFEEKPDAEYPYAKTNKTADSIKWYKYAPSFTTKEVVENVTDEATQVQYDAFWEGSYNNAGYWEPNECFDDPNDPTIVTDYTIDMAVSLSVGDILKITVSDGFDGDVHEYFEEEVFTKDGNTYTYVSEADSSFNFYIHNATAAYTADISIDFVEYDVTEISGQNKEIYSGEGNQLVACHASFESGKYLIKTDMVELGTSWITGQPTADAPTLETNKPADSYQWYDYKTVTKSYNYVKTVFDSEKEIAFDDIDINMIGSYTEVIGKNILANGEYDQNGYWKVAPMDPNNPSNTEYYFEGFFAFNEGDKFKLDIKGSDSNDPQNLDYEIDGSASSMNDYWDLEDFEKADDGSYIVPKGAIVFNIGVYTENANIKVKITRTTEPEVLTAVDGQTAKTFTGESGTYLVKAFLADGTVLRSDVIKYEKKVAPAPTPAPDENEGGQGSGTAIPDTGDTASIALWFMTAIVSLAVLAGVTVYKKRTEK